MADIRTGKIEAAKEKLESVKRAMQKRSEVYYNGKLYRVQAIRMYYSAAFGGIVYQAELVDSVPRDWNSVLTVALERVETELGRVEEL